MSACSCLSWLCSEMTWDARRHRRNLLPRRQRGKDGTYNKLDGRNPFHLHGKYIDADARALSRLRRVSFFVGPTFLIGSVLFIIGAAAGEFPGYFYEMWSTGKIDGLVNIPYLVRTASSTPASLQSFAFALTAM